MSYGVSIIRIKIEEINEELTKSKGIGSARLISAGMQNCEDRSIVEELVLHGQATQSDAGDLYYYALQGIMTSIGTPIYARNWFPVEIPQYAVLEESGLRSLQKYLSIEIPEPEDFPWVLALKNDDITDELLHTIETNLDNPSLYNEFYSWIKAAKHYEEDLVLYLS